ncbi:MAG: hypothetical protein ABI995_01055 [Acidobacteriota bacterium]
MTIPFSAPTTPAQPNAVSYGFRELELFKTYTRETFRAAFGIQAPAFNPSKLIKTWFDSTVPDTSDDAFVVIYKIIARDQKERWGFRQLVMPAAEAGAVNLPGQIQYQEYAIAPTTANRAGVSPIWPIHLSLESEAHALLKELGLPDVPLTDQGVGSSFPVNYGDEPRRMWDFAYRGVSYGVGGLISNKYRNGIGSPGHWTIGDTIEWLPDPPAATGLDDHRAPREVPVRDLLPNELISAGLMGPMIVRTDLQKLAGDTAGQFSADDRTLLREIHGMVSALNPKS